MSAPRDISIANRHRRLKFDRRAVAGAISVLDTHAARFRGGCPAGELSIVFMTDDALARLHADFLDDPAPTDVITFTGDPALGSAGEICVSADAALRHLSTGPRSRVRSLNSQLSTFNSAAAAFSAELALYLVHGWLHLAGYDDLQPALKRRMRAAEARATKLLQAAGALPVFALRK